MNIKYQITSEVGIEDQFFISFQEIALKMLKS